MTAAASLHCQKVRGHELPRGITVAEHLHGVLRPDECVITTRSCDSQLPRISGRPMISHDARYHFDPDSLQYRSHVGRHPSIVGGLLRHKNFFDNMIWLVQQVVQCPNMVIDIYCKSGRHRLVGEGRVLATILESLGIKFTLVHCQAREKGRGWMTMHCGGGCNECGWFNDKAYDEVVTATSAICSRMKQIVERMPNAPAMPNRKDASVVDLTTAATGLSAEEVTALQGQVTKLTEMVEKLANDQSKKDGRSKASRRRRRSRTLRTRSRSRRRGRARDVRDSTKETSRAIMPSTSRRGGAVGRREIMMR